MSDERKLELTQIRADALGIAEAHPADLEAGVPGFGVRATKAGGHVYVLSYVLRGRQKWFTIGRDSEWTAEEARKEALRLREEIAKGIDPAGERKIRLSKSVIDALPACDSRAFYWDSEIPGFGLRVSPGGGRVFVLKYWLKGRTRWFTIGRHGGRRGGLTPDEARRKALKLRGDIAGGIDPLGEREKERQVLTFRELVALYFAEGVAHKKQSTLRVDRRRAELHVVPLIGAATRVDAITRRDVERLLNAVILGKTAAKKPDKRKKGSLARGGRGVAAQCVNLLSAILQFGVDRGERRDNPARGVKRPSVRKMERFLSFDELGRLADALEAELAETNNVYTVAAIKLLALTGCRRGEVLGLRWADVDLERGFLQLRESKTGEKAVHLGPSAVQLLKGLRRTHENPFVIAGRNGKPSSAVDATWDRVRLRAGLPDVRLHDLRHTYASIGAGASIGLPIIGKLLGHTQASTTARYAHLADDPVRRAGDAISEAIAAAMGERGSPT